MIPLKVAQTAFSLFLCTLFAGCGKNLSIPNIPVSPATSGTGNWVFFGHYAKGQDIFPYAFGGSLNNSGGQISGVFHIDQPCFDNGAADIPYTGTLDKNNHLNITSSPVSGQVLTLQGLLSSNDSILTQGYFTIIGGCTGSLVSLTGRYAPGASFDPTGQHVPSLTNIWNPEIFSSNPVLIEQLTQSPTPDAHGDYALTGTVSVQGSACFTHGTLQPNSFVSGILGQQIILMDDGSTLNATLQVAPQSTGPKPVLNLYPGTITGGSCNGPVDISLQ